GVTVVDPRWPIPVPPALVELARDYRAVFTVEDGIRTGGVGDAIARALRDARVTTGVHAFGVPPGWHPPGTRTEVLAAVGVRVEGVATAMTQRLSARTEAVVPAG